MNVDINYAVQEMFDEGLAELTAHETLTIAGRKLLRQKEKFQPGSDLIKGYTYRGGGEANERENAAGQKKIEQKESDTDL